MRILRSYLKILGADWCLTVITGICSLLVSAVFYVMLVSLYSEVGSRLPVLKSLLVAAAAGFSIWLFLSVLLVCLRQPDIFANTYIVTVSLLFSLIMVCLFYPGFHTSDSEHRLHTAQQLFRDGQPLSGRDPALLPLLQAAAHRASGDIGLFTFAQAIVLTLALGALTLRLAGPRATTVIFPVILVMPTVWPWVFVQVSDIPIAAGLAMAAWAILALSGTPGGSARFAWSFFILFCSTVLILGSRSNTPALLPVVIMLVYLSCKHLRRKIIAIASVLTALAATMLMQSLLADTSYNRLSDVIAWEYVLTLKELADPQALEVYNLDSIGQTRIAVRMARYDRHDSLVFGSSPPLPSEKLRLQSYRVFSGFANLVSQYPREYLSAKLKIHRQLLALDNTVRYKLFTADHPRIKWRGGAVYRPLIPHFGDNLAASVGSLDVLNPLYLPYANLIICLVLAGIALVVDSDRRWPYAVVLALAVGNYGIFFLITPAATFRYFLPTHILFLVVSLDALTALAVRIRQRLAGVFEDVS